MKPRTVPARMSAKRRAQFEAEGRVPFSTIRKKLPCGTVEGHGRPKAARSRYQAPPAGKIKRSKRIPPRKKRTGTPIRSKPFENRLDKRSHYTASGNLKLYGNDKKSERRKIFQRACGRCENAVPMDFMPSDTKRCPNPATEWSHKPCVHLMAGSGHGQGFKCDAAECGIASCEGCHRREHGQY